MLPSQQLRPQQVDLELQIAVVADGRRQDVWNVSLEIAADDRTDAVLVELALQ